MMGWISIKYRLPEININHWSDPAMVYNGQMIAIGNMDNNKKWFCYDDCGDRVTGITHWMPLPEPPKDIKS